MLPIPPSTTGELETLSIPMSYHVTDTHTHMNKYAYVIQTENSQMYLNKYNDMHAFQMNTLCTFLDIQLLSFNIYQQIRHNMLPWTTGPSSNRNFPSSRTVLVLCLNT